MDVYKTQRFRDVVKGNSYPGRGIVAGESCDGSNAVIAYFIMGRSENSRNRIFREKDGVIFTEAFDISKLEDPSLIIYAAVRRKGNHLVVTNGSQTDTICQGLSVGMGFYSSLESRCFEPDAPNFTPRISAELEFDGSSDFVYRMSILKSEDAAGSACSRFGYDYTPLPGIGHFIHTYECDGDPLPSFRGEPHRIEIPDDIDGFTNEIWGALDSENRISLYVRYTDLITGEEQSRLINKNK